MGNHEHDGGRELSPEETLRYARHLILPEVGPEGQRRLKAARVLLIGAGGLGSPLGLYLAAAGVGTIGIVDDDRVSLSNLQRQILHGTKDVGREKTASARETLGALNPEVAVNATTSRLTEDNAAPLIEGYDFVLDASDNFSTKFLINDTCVRLQKPYAHAGVVGFKGQAFTYAPGSLCYRCIFPEDPPAGMIQDCRGSGTLGAVAGAIGSIQAAEAIKHILGTGTLLTDRMLIVDLFSMDMRTVPLTRNYACPTCG